MGVEQTGPEGPHGLRLLTLEPDRLFPHLLSHVCQFCPEILKEKKKYFSNGV